MKKCPYCAEEIQDEAIVCKHCGKDLRPSAVASQPAQPTPKAKRKVSPLLIIVTLVLVTICIVLFAVLQGDKSPSSTKVGDATKPEPTAPVLTVYKIGDMVEIGSLVMTVNSFTFSQGNSSWAPDAGKQFALVDVTFENKGSESEHLSGMLQMGLKDDSGMEYSESMSADIAGGNSTPTGEIVPGDKLRGIIGFEVPTSAKGFRFMFDASLFRSGKIFVDLGK